jgi:hypothetical protein
MADDQTLKDQETQENEEAGEKGGQATGETSDVDFESDMALDEEPEYEE